jgi:isoquinoline 1-oxidoreductase beta subunit
VSLRNVPAHPPRHPPRSRIADVSGDGGVRGLSRREFLIRTGWVAAGVTVLTSCSRLPALPTFARPDLDDALLWVQALADGRIRFLCPKSEMGQGIKTGLAQVVAEELDVPLDAIEVVVPDTDQIHPVMLTAGSMSTRTCFEPLSRAAAALRETLRERAAQRAGTDAAQVRDAPGGFDLPDGSHVTYGVLVGDAPSVIGPDEALARRAPRHARPGAGAYRRLGHPAPPLDVRAIVTGREVYSRDVVVPGMAYGRVVSAPRPGAVLGRVDVAAARALPGIVAVMVDEPGARVGVVAEEPFALERAVAALSIEWRGGQSVEWDDLARELDVARAQGRFRHTVVSDGDPERAAARAVKRLDARYDTSLMAHAAMEPRAGVVSVTAHGVEVWTGSQDPWYMRALVARLTGHSDDRVVVHNHRMGGAFGGRKRCQATLEAAWLSARTRRPVRVQWSREQEFRGNTFQPPFSHQVEAGVDADGRITHWRHDFTACPIVFDSVTVPRGLHWLADLPADPGTARGATPPYRIADRRVRFSEIRIPVTTGAWRGLGAAPNTTAIEIAMDELAQMAGLDPIEFRLRNLGPESARLAAVLRELAALSRWSEGSPQGRGRGVACAVYEGTTCVAVAIEVAADPSGAIRPTRAWCAHDCGLVVNPDGVAAQIEGNIAWGCSMALHERMGLHDGELHTDNFDTYPVLRASECPDVQISLAGSQAEPPTGVGEPTIAPTPAALANAVSAATGKRVRRLPIQRS